ncbi:hypothetical protein CBR_g4624 [Chara braunii]|uniref:Reverse transcriptase/retrotransposon-derived protein RNase H-like domain-containing protein n=1 Tax=Chara braunii TaxID=69332 RepID=A0A388KIB9_CHABU|nr:hypothetical protein CBR_g4624 [Chara braunii]|eukprot:GBG69795.1 hypothetical protein CBR_g4624 [Chara braunii]
MIMLEQEEEEKRKAAEEEVAAEEEEEVEEEPLERRRGEFARDVVTHVGAELKKLKEGAEKFCAGAIEGAKVVATAEAESRPRKEPVQLKFPNSYNWKKDESFDNWEASVNTYVYLQHIAPEEQVLVAFHALKDEAASFARSLTRAADCGHNMIAYSRLTPLSTFLKLLRERFADVTRGVRASNKLQTIHLRQLRSARALKGVMDDLVAVPDHGVTKTQLLKKEAIWQWDKDCTSALKKLKHALIEYPVLKVANPSLPFVVTMDASQYGIGAVLQQDDYDGYKPVEFMSGRMPSEKVATSTYERELYALRQALEHWKHYLLGRHFKVYSNHETLRWLKTQAKMTPKLTRWAAEIDQYDFELKPVKGKYNVVADALSRRSDYFGAIVHYLDIGSDVQEKVRQAYAHDPIYSDLLKRVKAAPETEPDYRTRGVRVGIRMYKYVAEERAAGRMPFIDPFKKRYPHSYHGVPLGGIGGGSIGRGWRGDFRRFQLLPAVCEEEPVMADQFSAFVFRGNYGRELQSYSSVLYPGKKEETSNRELMAAATEAGLGEEEVGRGIWLSVMSSRPICERVEVAVIVAEAEAAREFVDVEAERVEAAVTVAEVEVAIEVADVEAGKTWIFVAVVDGEVFDILFGGDFVREPAGQTKETGKAVRKNGSK